jgi:hypothetical protein
MALSRAEWEEEAKKNLPSIINGMSIDDEQWWKLPISKTNFRLTQMGYTRFKIAIPKYYEYTGINMGRLNGNSILGLSRITSPFYLSSQKFCTWSEDDALMFSMLGENMDEFILSYIS